MSLKWSKSFAIGETPVLVLIEAAIDWGGMVGIMSCKLKQTSQKGYGVFAERNIKAGECIFQVDLSQLKRYTLAEIDSNPDLDGDHSDYVGHGKYAIDDSLASYVNHSCDPNCYYKMHSIARKDMYALRDIHVGEELTHDYAATAVDQFADAAGDTAWVLDCKCGSLNCRDKVKGDFFGLSQELQRRYYANLPPSVKRKYRHLFESDH